MKDRFIYASGYRFYDSAAFALETMHQSGEMNNFTNPCITEYNTKDGKRYAIEVDELDFATEGLRYEAV
jgi:hypothetical protein